MRDFVLSRLEQSVTDSNLDDDYDSEYRRSAGSRDCADLRAWLDARRVQRKQQAENQPPVRATPEEERLTQIQAKIDRLLAEHSISNPIREVFIRDTIFIPNQHLYDHPFKDL